VKVPHFAMVNLIAGKEVVPELVQHDFSAENVVRRLNEIIPDGSPRSKMLTDLARVRVSLGGTGDGDLHPVDRAAEAVLAVLGTAKASKIR